MKYLHIPAIIAVATIAGCFSDYRTLPPEQQHVQVVHEVALSKDRIYLAAQTWFAQNLGKSKEALQIQDKESGLIVGWIVLPDAIKDGAGIMTFPMKISVKIEAKDNKYRASYEDFRLAGAGVADGRNVMAGREHEEAKAAALKLDAAILAAIKGGAVTKDF
jgi:hypothetical protein